MDFRNARDFSFNCIECGAVVAGPGVHQERGFCSRSCMASWNEWMIREQGRNIPGLSDMFSDGGFPTLEQTLLYIMIVLGGLVRTFVTEDGEFTVTAAFEWSCPDHGLFIGDPAAAFTGIEGFSLSDDEIYLDHEENIGRRRAELRKSGKNLTMMCLDLAMEILAVKRRFDRECDRWAEGHALELKAAANRWMASPERTLALDGLGYGEFLKWLDSLGNGGRRWA